ncbi:hypothetical protein DITRI_Ditri14bG0017800 [Diplodiscus trichospermus]
MWNFASKAFTGANRMKTDSSKPSQVSSEYSDDDTSLSNSGDERLECPICWESFNIVENIPYICFMGNVKFPSKNYFLLWMVESMNGDRSKSNSSFHGSHPPELPVLQIEQ